MRFLTFRKAVFGMLAVWLAGTLIAAPAAKQPKETPLTLTTKDGWSLAAVYLPAKPEMKTVILLHDLNKNKEAFTTFKAALVKNGFGYLALDLRGHGQSTNLGAVRSFAKEGVDNQFNKMTRDVDAAISFLQEKKVPMDQIALLGTGLGANVAAKATTFWPEIGQLALLSPTANVRNVLAIPPMRLYKGNLLIGAAAADKKMFLEASVIRNVAYVTAGEDTGKITFLTAYDLTSHEMLDKYLIPTVIQWLVTPSRPDVLPDEPSWEERGTDAPEDTSGVAIAPSNTEEALVPSLLGE